MKKEVSSQMLINDIELSKSIKLARLVGPVLIIMTMSEMVNANIWSTNTVVNIYENGFLLFTGGVAIAIYHNVWKFNWQVSLTIVGWCAMLLGAVRMFFPLKQLTWAHQVEPIFFFALVTMVAGIYIMFRGYRTRL